MAFISHKDLDGGLAVRSLARRVNFYEERSSLE